MNNAERTRRELMIRAIKDYYDGILADTIDRIPIEMRPRTAEPNRCCIYKDRAMLKYRLMALLGFGMEEERDETMPLREYLKLAEAGKNHTAAVLSVCSVGCHGCVDSHVQVSSSCVGCFARPCVATCPRQAITVINQRSTIDRSKCINCGKCIAVCPYHAIIRNPLPCEDVCPVGAIGKAEDGRVKLDFSKCIYCGKCFRACPFSTIMERSQLINILNALKSGRKVVAMVAPSITDQFPGKIEQLFAALKMAGFHDIIEVALGAELTTKHEAEEFYERMARGEKLMTSSCCPAWVLAAQRHIPDIVPMVSSTPSPMGYAGRLAREKYPDAVNVFIGPCIAKRREAQSDPNTDFVMTFEELGALFAALEIDVISLNAEPLAEPATSFARNFAHSCGVTEAILEEMSEESPDPKRPKIDGKFINGLDRKSVNMLKMYAKGKLPGNFVEVMACTGGCVGGPCSLTR